MDLESLIAARPKRRENLRAWYEALLEAADCTGTSVSELACLLGCSRETVYSWRRRLSQLQTDEDDHTSPRLVRVRVAETSATQDAARLEIRARSGHAVLVPSTFDPRTLATVLEVLARC